MHRAAREGCKGVLLALLTAAAGSEAAVLERFIDPTVTDPAIRPLLELPGAATRRLDHFVTLDPSARNGLLYVHLVGSGGVPENSQQYARHVAAQGYHVISLAYPNWPSVGELTAGLGDGAAPGAVREERLFGIDASPLVDVDVANSVVNRLQRLLDYLHQQHPDEGWSRFRAGDGVAWRRLVVGGHSQGAGHAAYLALRFELAGAVLLGGPGDFVAGVGLADWLSTPSATPAGRFRSFVHALDDSYDAYQAAQGALGLAAFGAVEDVDVLAPLPWASHRLTSTRLDVPNGNYHGAVVTDRNLPLGPDGAPAYAEAWRYLLEVPVFVDGFDD